jgi:hypothetical protein
VGGLLLLTLYTTPVVYLYLDRLGGWMQRLMRGTKLRLPLGRKLRICLLWSCNLDL